MSGPEKPSAEESPKRRDTRYLLALFALLLLLALPALLGWCQVLRSDCLNEALPRMIALARGFQSGTIPLWDPHTFAGGRPFYADDSALLFYPPMWPFYLVTDTTSVTGVGLTLVILPFLLHQVWGALGAYLFFRRYLKLGASAGFLGGLLWAWTPDMLLLIESVHDLCLFSYLPWLTLAVAGFMRTGTRRRWFKGVLLFALVNSIGQVHFLVRIYFVLGVTAGLLWLFAPGRRGRFTWTGLGRLAGALGMMVVPIGLLGFAWGGVLEGFAWIRNAVALTVETAGSMRPESSMPPLYAVTLLVPGFYGVLDTRHAWGAALAGGVTNVSCLGGGFLLLTAAVAAVARLFRYPRLHAGTNETARHSLALQDLRSSPSPGARRCPPRTELDLARGAEPPSRDDEGKLHERLLHAWTVIGLVLVLGGLIAMTGRYTPVFRWLCALLPWFFRIPHAVYYRFAVTWGLVLLAGIGMHRVRAGGARYTGRTDWRLPAACLGAAALGILAALLASSPLPSAGGNPVPMRGYEMLSQLGDREWLLAVPLLGLGIAAAWGLWACAQRDVRRRASWLFAGICIERGVLGIVLLYVSMTAVQTRTAEDPQAQTGQYMVDALTTYEPYELAATMKTLSGKDKARWTCTDALCDNQAWSTGGRAMLGFNTKPLLPRLRRLVERFTTGAPYNVTIQTVPIAFLRNMGVKYLCYPREAGATPLRRVTETEMFAVDEFSFPLPYVYTQDRIVRTTDFVASHRLYESDLRRAAYLQHEEPGHYPVIIDSDLPLHADETQRFNALQASNRVTRVERPSPNRILIEATIRKPGMLVVTECWHPGWRATTNGAPARLHRANHVLQGLWLDPGRYTVDLRFLPPTMMLGGLVSLLSGVLLTGIAVWPGKGRSVVKGHGGDKKRGIRPMTDD